MPSAWATVLLYSAAAAAFITISVFQPRFMLSWVEGAGFLLLAVWLVPAIVRRLRR